MTSGIFPPFHLVTSTRALAPILPRTFPMLTIVPELLTTGQVAQLLGYGSKTSVERKIKSGELPLTAYRRANYKVYRRADVLAYIDNLEPFEAESA